MTTSFFAGIFTGFMAIIKSLYIFLVPILVIIALFFLILLYRYIEYRYVKHIAVKKPSFDREPKTSLLKNLFVIWPKTLAHDILTRDPEEFMNDGIFIVVGEQGSGKTMAVAYLLQEWKKRYPRMLTYTNMCYEHQDGELSHWQQIIDRKNTIYGVCNVIDEIKVWFSNRESSKVPLALLHKICQLRKEKKAIIGTVQVFSELAKPFRSQTKLIYVPFTVAGSLTVVRITKAKYYNEEKNCFKKYIGSFVLAQTEELRNAYDTNMQIEKYKDYDFVTPSSELFAVAEEAPHVEVSGTEK